METLLEFKKLKKKLPPDGDYFSFNCAHCTEICYVSEPMKNSILTCSFCGEEIIEFRLRIVAEKEANVKKIISEMISPKLTSSVKDLLNSDKFDNASTPTSTFQGTWDTNYGSMTFKERDNMVEGAYPLNGGKIRGIVRGETLIGKWSQKPSYSEPNDSGDLEFRLTDEGKSFKGRWKYGSSDDWKFDWNGKLINR